MKKRDVILIACLIFLIILISNHTNFTGLSINNPTDLSCYDSDGGNNINLYGAAQGINGLEKDTCGSSLTNRVAYVSYCDGINCGVIEAVCNPSGTSTTMSFQQCPNGCSNGACIEEIAEEPSGPICGDSTCDNEETCSNCPKDCGVCPAVCGNRIREGTEQCDDGNNMNGDGCSMDCKITSSPPSSYTNAQSCTNAGHYWHYTYCWNNKIINFPGCTVNPNNGICTQNKYDCYDNKGVVHKVNTLFEVDGHKLTCGKYNRVVLSGEKPNIPNTNKVTEGLIYDGDSGPARCAMSTEPNRCPPTDSPIDTYTCKTTTYYSSSKYNQDKCCGDDEGECINKYESYFDDPFYQDILSGKTKYNMASFNRLCGPGSTAKSNEYGFKIINAIKQLGYFLIMPCSGKINIHGKNNVAIILLNAYQRDNNFPESDYVDKAVLQKMNSQIRESEKRDNSLAKEFTCYNYIKDAPPNDASKDHRAFLFQLAMSAFPEKLKIKNLREGECLNGQISFISCDAGSSKYWLGYDDNCNLKTDFDVIESSRDDYTMVATMIHEYAHLIDLNGYIDTTTFYDISYDVSDKVFDNTWDFYKPRIDINNNKQVKENFFSYAEGWKSNNYPGYYTAYEDFAVSVEMYVTNGIVFRDYMKDKPILIRKYNWIKENIFNGREFNTGDKNYKSYIPDLSSNGLAGTGIISAGLITELRPEYKWDYVI